MEPLIPVFRPRLIGNMPYFAGERAGFFPLTDDFPGY
jgi:hypothetical protein